MSTRVRLATEGLADRRLPPVCIACGRPAGWRNLMRFEDVGRRVQVSLRAPLCTVHAVVRTAAAGLLAAMVPAFVGAGQILLNDGPGATAFGALAGAAATVAGGIGGSTLGLRTVSIAEGVLEIEGVSAWFAAAAGPYTACRACGYDLRGNASGRCPECGLPAPGPILPETRHG